MLSIRQLEQFLAVAEAMSFRRAAERLNMAQPPLTAAIRQLEEMLGVRLFERTNRITLLTHAGQILREEGLRTIAQAERAVALVRRAGAGAIGRARVGFVASAMSSLVPSLVARYRESHPDVLLELVEGPTASQIEWLQNGNLDVGIVVLPLPPECEPAIATWTLMQSHLAAALPAGCALAECPHTGLPLAELAMEPWIMFSASDGPGLHATIIAACAQAGFSPKVVQRAIQMETIIGLVAARLGVALVPAAYLELRRPGVIFRPVIGTGTPVPYNIALAWRRSETSPVVLGFLASVRATVYPLPNWKESRENEYG